MTTWSITDPELDTWVTVPEGSDFPLQNLPYGAFAANGDVTPVIGVAIGDQVLDLRRLAEAGLLDGTVNSPLEVFASPNLNPFLAEGRNVWVAVRDRLTYLLRSDVGELRDNPYLVSEALVPQAEAELHLPFSPKDYVDFYSSIEHATNLGRMFRPESDPLLPNWRHLPVGYHGRSSTIVVSRTPIVRPRGQVLPKQGAAPGFGPSARLDFELEVGFVTGPSNKLGRRVPPGDAAEHIFGFVLVNDWSARDIQAWEYQPLGPFLGKSFATSVSPWVVPLDALAPFKATPPTQDPKPLPYLLTDDDWAYDIELEVWLKPNGQPVERISRTNFKHMYWTPAQQLAHTTVNGAVVSPGDLYASGTVSGSEPDTYGSLIELSWNGANPVELQSGVSRAFLEDGDTVIIRGECERPGWPRIGFGEVHGEVLPAVSALH